jgi:peroxiredoxin
LGRPVMAGPFLLEAPGLGFALPGLVWYLRRMVRISGLSLAKLVLVAAAGAAIFTFAQQGNTVVDAEKPILASLGSLRSVPDADRGRVTRQLALDIRQLAPGTRKVGLAMSLANLSTEGDFGHDTLQEVADTLAQALREQPAPSKNGEVAAPYFELAQLAICEHVKVALTGPEFGAALLKVNALERIRAYADFTLTDLEGNSWTRSSLKGKVVLVNFWATWCPPCRKEMPDLESLYQKYKAQGLVILAISDEDSSKVKPFIAEHKYTYPVLLDTGRKVNSLYQVDGIPKSFIYNRQGKMVASAIDMRTMGQFTSMLAAAGLH